METAETLYFNSVSSDAASSQEGQERTEMEGGKKAAGGSGICIITYRLMQLNFTYGLYLILFEEGLVAH